MKKNDNEGEISEMGFRRIEIDPTTFNQDADPENLMILPTRNLVLFPGQTVTFELSRDNSRKLAEWAAKEHLPIGVVCQKDVDMEKPSLSDLNAYGTLADVFQIFEANGTMGALVRARDRFEIISEAKAPLKGQLAAKVKFLSEIEAPNPLELDVLCEQIRKVTEEALRHSDPAGILDNLKNIHDDNVLVNYLCTNLPLETGHKLQMIAQDSIYDRAMTLLGELNIFRHRMKLTEEIMERARQNLNENQKNAFLQSQMDAIRDTLYGDDADEVDDLAAAATLEVLPENVHRHFHKEINKLRRFNPSSPDYSVLYSYLETLLALPWKQSTEDKSSLEEAAQILEKDHYGLEKVKERVLEQLALMMHNPEGKSPIICLVGAPGVGKTSIGRSIASALGRKYERVSFGGLHDEAEIRGHRRTYIGAMPGRIIDALKRAGSNNPVIVLDEIDKIGNDYKGDPSAALLEVLDPEQNCHFHDNYIDIDFDLSNVLFIATANTLDTIPRPLLDRMEIIEIPGYLLEEKMEIARRHLLPRVLQAQKLKKSDIRFTDEGLQELIKTYTAESGVRQLDKRISAIGRKMVLAKMQNKKVPHTLKPEHLYGFLGLAPYLADNYEGNQHAGVVTGLAWTQVGGEILMVESALAPAKQGSLVLTGKLGEVMKESATVAYEWVKVNSTKLGINPELFDKYTLHIHFPEGAIPKDGPSAGITIATSIVSAFRQTRVAPRLAMTGEITLRGKVLPVGGIREKILAAKRAGIETIIMSDQNRRDIDDMPARYTDGLTFHFVDTVDEVIKLAVTDIPAADAISL